MSEDKKRMQLGLSVEEEAFFEILARHKSAITDFNLIKEIVKEITASIKNKLQIDCSQNFAKERSIGGAKGDTG